MIRIGPERDTDAREIEALLDRAFGPDRMARPSYALRHGTERLRGLCFGAREEGRIAGTIRFCPVIIGQDVAAILLGPIAVRIESRNRGIGARLARRGLRACREQSHRIVVAIGTKAYLGRFGFEDARTRGLEFDPTVEDDRFLVCELVPDALDGVTGAVRAAPPPKGQTHKRRRPNVRRASAG
jgi:predicted N-acetyltransferase YhbS